MTSLVLILTTNLLLVTTTYPQSIPHNGSSQCESCDPEPLF